MSRGEIILFLDQDCIPEKDWFKNMVNFFRSNPDIHAVGGRIMPLPSQGIINDYFNRNNTLNKPIIDRITGEIVTLITGNAGFRISAIKSINGFDENVFNKFSHGGEDVDVTYRLRKRGFRVGYEPNAVVFHEYPKKFSSVFYKYANYGRGMRLFCLARHVNPTEIRQPKLNFFSSVLYFFKIPWKTIQSFRKFSELKLNKTVPFALLDVIKYLGHGYGYFFPNYKSKFIAPRQ